MASDTMRKTRSRTTTHSPEGGSTRVTTRRVSGKSKIYLMKSPEERHRMIAERAYYKAESRGFQGGTPEQDWMEAEAEIDTTLTSRS